MSPIKIGSIVIEHLKPIEFSIVLSGPVYKVCTAKAPKNLLFGPRNLPYFMNVPIMPFIDWIYAIGCTINLEKSSLPKEAMDYIEGLLVAEEL